MTNFNKYVEEIIFLAVCFLACVIAAYALHMLLDFQDYAWHQNNDVCITYCSKNLSANQKLDSYRKDSLLDDNNIACECIIKVCYVPDCSTYETKTLFTNVMTKK